MISVDLPTGIKQGTVSTLMRSEAAAVYRAGDDCAGRSIQPVMFIWSDQTVSERDLPALSLGEKVVANDRFTHYHRLNDMFDRVDVTYLAGATFVGCNVIAAGVETE